MLSLYVKVRNFMNREEGQGMVEYALIIGLIAIGVLAVLGLLSGSVQGIFTSIKDALDAATTP